MPTSSPHCCSEPRLLYFIAALHYIQRHYFRKAQVPVSSEPSVLQPTELHCTKAVSYR